MDLKPTNAYYKNVGANIEKTLLVGRNIKEKEDVSRHPLFI